MLYRPLPNSPGSFLGFGFNEPNLTFKSKDVCTQDNWYKYNQKLICLMASLILWFGIKSKTLRERKQKLALFIQNNTAKIDDNINQSNHIDGVVRKTWY